MPLYEYQCDDCGNRFERIQKFSDSPVEKCPSCGGAVRKLISSPAIQFKGSGWYITDYARKQEKTTDSTGKAEGGAAGSESSASPAAASEGSATGKGDSKESKGAPKESPAGESKAASKPAAEKSTPGSTS